MHELYNAVKTEVSIIILDVGAVIGVKIGASIGGTLGTTLAGPLGTIIGALAGLVLGYVIGELIYALKDDIFQPQVATLLLPSANSTFGGSLISPTYSFTYEDHAGRYIAYYRWRIVR